MSENKDSFGNRINIKIGIHTGNCFMGVIGYHKPQFSLIGDVVNTASRVCSTGDPNHIMVSEEAFSHVQKQKIDKKYTITPKVTFMKGKGDKTVFHIY
jgi:class 3 adenylate cyclase